MFQRSMLADIMNINGVDDKAARSVGSLASDTKQGRREFPF